MKREYVEIPIDKIIIPESRVRSYQDEASDIAFKGSVRKYGILQPILVVRKDDKYELIAGESRVKYAKQSNLPTIPAIVLEVTDETDKTLISLIENRARGAIDPAEFLRALEQLMDKGYSLKEIAELVGYSYDYLKQWSRIKNQPEQLKTAVITGALDLPVALEIASLSSEEQKLDALESVLTMPTSVSREEKIAFIRHYYKKQCDECKQTGKEIMQYGEKWLCEECAKKLGKLFRPEEPVTSAVRECFTCNSRKSVHEFHSLWICSSCREKIYMVIDAFKLLMGKNLGELDRNEIIEGVSQIKIAIEKSKIKKFMGVEK